MSRRPRRRLLRGALVPLALILLASGAIRLVDGAGAATAKDTEAGSVAPTPPGEPVATPVPGDGPFDVDALRGLLETLRMREAELAERERALEARSRQLKIAEQTIAENMAALIAAEEKLESTLALADGAMEADIDRLTRVYETMKPKEAAALFETMDPTFAAGFLARMRPEAAAGILAGLTPEAAYSISILFAGRNRDVPKE